MPAIIAWLIVALKGAVGQIIVSAMLWIGITWGAAEFVLPNIQQFVLDQVSGAPEVFVQYAGYVGADVAMTMMLSASAIRAGRSALVLKKRQP